MRRPLRLLVCGVLATIPACRGASSPPGEGALALCQVPPAPSPPAHPDARDIRYPAGSRVVLAAPPHAAARLRVLSAGLAAAGGPVVSHDGRRVLFMGKAAGDPWQIFEADLRGGAPRRLTAIEGGAMDPALLPDGSVVFASPVPGPRAGGRVPALYARPRDGGAARRLTFAPGGAFDPTVLLDGRILFVSEQPGPVPRLALFTVNNDGTGISGFAAHHSGARLIARPREIPGGRVVILASEPGPPVVVGAGAARDAPGSPPVAWKEEEGREHAPAAAARMAAMLRPFVEPPVAEGAAPPPVPPAAGPAKGFAEQVLLARPSRSRGPLVPDPGGAARSVESAGDGTLLVALARPGARRAGTFAIHRLRGEGAAEVLLDDPEWHDIEAVAIEARRRPMGHLSTMDPSKSTGLLLCVDANLTTVRREDRAVRVRVVAAGGDGVEPLGEIPLAEDGSFYAEVPADRALGFEALDREGHVLRRLPPSVWVRPGEIRGCVGCHEPHHQAPPNRRPLAVKSAPVRIGGARSPR